jgi:serine/threonine protein kinase
MSFSLFFFVQRGAAHPENNQAQLEQSLRELRILNSCRHDNILPLFGFSVGGYEPCLVYQFMPNGSLEDRLLCRVVIFYQYYTSEVETHCRILYYNFWMSELRNYDGKVYSRGVCVFQMCSL